MKNIIRIFNNSFKNLAIIGTCAFLHPFCALIRETLIAVSPNYQCKTSVISTICFKRIICLCEFQCQIM